MNVDTLELATLDAIRRFFSLVRDLCRKPRNSIRGAARVAGQSQHPSVSALVGSLVEREAARGTYP